MKTLWLQLCHFTVWKPKIRKPYYNFNLILSVLNNSLVSYKTQLFNKYYSNHLPQIIVEGGGGGNSLVVVFIVVIVFHSMLLLFKLLSVDHL